MLESPEEMLKRWDRVECTCDDSVGWVCEICHDTQVVRNLIEGKEVLTEKHRDAIAVAKALREYIDAIPRHVEFNVAMPGVDRDWIDGVLDAPV